MKKRFLPMRASLLLLGLLTILFSTKNEFNMQIHGKQIKDQTVKAAKIDFAGFTPSNDFDPVTKKFLEDNKLIVAPASAPYLQIQNGNELYLKALAITDVHVDSNAFDLTSFIADNYTNGSEFQEGDTIILTNADGGTKIYLHNGDTTGAEGDFTEIEKPALTDPYIRNLLSSGNGLSYNPSIGRFSVVDSYIRGLLSGTGLIGYSATNGQFSLTESTIRNLISAGVNLDYDSLSGQIRLQAILDEVVEYGFLGVPSGNGKVYNNTSGAASGQQLPTSSVISFIQSGDILWACTSLGLWRYNTITSQGTIFNTSSGAASGQQLPVNNTLAVLQTGDILWVGTNQGLWRYNTVTGEGLVFTTSFGAVNGQQLPSNSILRSSLFSSGDILWVGTDGGGIWRFNMVTGTGTVFNTSSGAASGQQLPNNNVHCVFQDGNILWAGTSNGLWRYDINTGHGTVFNTSSGAASGQQLPANLVRDVLQVGNIVWAGTSTAGLWRYDTVSGQGSVFNTLSGAVSGAQLPGPTISGMFQFGDILWVAAQPSASIGGIWKYNMVTGEGSVLNSASSVASGLPMPSNFTNVVLQSNDVLWVATSSGLWRYTLANLPHTFQSNDLVHKQYVDDAINAAILAAAIPDSYIRSLFVDGNGLNYNAVTGTFSTDDAYIRGLFVDGNGLNYNAVTGTFSTDDAYIRGLIGAGRGITYDAAAGTVGVATPQTSNRHQTPLATTGDEAATGITLAAAPKGLIILAVNGKIESIGDGVKTQRAFFSADGGTTAKSLSGLVAGDTLYWNGTVAGYDLDANDTVDIYYI